MIKILIIEDDKNIVDLLELELRKQYRVISAYDGEAGLIKYFQEKPDLIILDIGLPKLNGYEVCRRIRQKRDYRTLIVMLSARAQEADQIVGRVIGAQKYLTKPFEIDSLLNEITKLLQSV